MSLRIWLPLNGNLDNLGLDQIEVVNNGATVDSNGKIGQCYYFNGSSCISLNGIDINNTWSYGCWFKEAASSRSWEGLIILNNTGGDSDIQFGFYMYPTGSRLQTTANGQYNSSVSHTFDNKWHHLFATFDGSTLRTYRDGSLINTKTITSSLLKRTYLTLGARRSGASTYGNYWIGYMNDFRVYDHCLSLKEIEELSKGLILHYKLDDPTLESTTNLITSISAGGQTTVSDNVVTTSGSNADTYFTLKLSEDITVNTQYTISCVAEMPPNTTWTFPVGGQSNTTLSWILKPGYNSYSFIANDFSFGTKRLFMDDLTGTARQSGKKCKFYAFQLEKKDHATGFAGYGATRGSGLLHDNSGNMNNGTSNNIVISEDSPKYSFSSVFNGTNSYVKVTNNNWNPQGMEQMTINIWAKATTWPNNGGRLLSCTETGGFNLEGGNSGYWRFPIHVYTNAEKTSTAYKYDSKEILISSLIPNEWNMITLVYDAATGTKTYINGELHHTYSNVSYGIHFNMNARLFLGCEANAASAYTPYFNGKESDFRIYATALTDTQIKELYDTSVGIDSNGNIYAREVIE